jgi:uncharacterized protein (UPF0262 family)
MENYRLDRSAFSIQTYKQAANQRHYWLSRSPHQRLTAAWYLICSAYNLNPNIEHRLDRTVFSIRKQLP